MRILLIAPLLAACTSPSAPSHLPNPLLLPFAAIGNGLSNASYNTRRAEVSRFVVANFDAIKQELGSTAQPLLTQAMALAKIPVASRAAFLSEAQQNPDIYQTANPEPLIVALMVYGP
ncbi:MAG: hypothetical protein GQ535_07740 [Rhodobacteraceae bacterium]|nr:hypothetical protein [Paracoccaceae bacterium]